MTHPRRIQTLCWIAICLVAVNVARAGAPQRPDERRWDSVPSRRLGPYTIYDVITKMKGGVEFKLYIAGNGIPSPKLFYTHYRAVSLLLSNTRKCLLINDYCATKQTRVVLVDIASGRQIDVGGPVVEAYKKSRKLDPRLLVVPVGRAFAPDDGSVLIEIELEYIAVSDSAAAGEPGKQFQPQWYLVGCPGGEIISRLGSRPAWYEGR